MKRLLILFPLFTALFSTAQMAEPEFRGVWIATVDNIDWPQRGVVDVAKQKAEFIRLLNLHKKNGMNAVIVPIGSCDLLRHTPKGLIPNLHQGFSSLIARLSLWMMESTLLLRQASFARREPDRR